MEEEEEEALFQCGGDSALEPVQMTPVIGGVIKDKGPFLESAGNFSGPRTDFNIETLRILAPALAHKPVRFVSSTNSCVLLPSKLLKR